MGDPVQYILHFLKVKILYLKFILKSLFDLMKCKFMHYKSSKPCIRMRRIVDLLQNLYWDIVNFNYILNFSARGKNVVIYPVIIPLRHSEAHKAWKLYLLAVTVQYQCQGWSYNVFYIFKWIFFILHPSTYIYLTSSMFS